MSQELPTHIVQSKEWGKIKTKLGTPAVRSSSQVQFTLHKIPFINRFFGYCPKVNPQNINWEEMKKLGRERGCIAIRFDTPNAVKGEYEDFFKEACKKAPKSTFSQKTLMIDLTKSEEELLKEMHPKTRYNIKLAQRKGVKVINGTKEDLDIFLKLQKETAKRQHFYIHPNNYYRTVFEELSKKNMAKLLIAKYKGKPLVSWMLFIYNKVIYYPYGGSSLRYRNLMPANLIAWEAIKLGKKLNCEIFDMWGIASDPKNTKDPWYGFTRFKLGFGGKIVEFENSYDLILNNPLYTLFNIANKIRWTMLNLRRYLPL